MSCQSISDNWFLIAVSEQENDEGTQTNNRQQLDTLDFGCCR